MALTIYNEVDYGEALYYGSADFNAELLWGLLIDWYQDETYDNGFNEARNLTDLSVDRGRDHLLGIRGWERYRPGRAIAILDNTDGRYDPFNTSSPIFGNIAPGKFAKIVVKYSGTTYDVMHGLVEDIQPFNQGKLRQVRITITDGLQFLAERLTFHPVFNDIAAVTLISGLADNAGWLKSRWPNAIYGSTKEINRVFFWKKNALRSIYDVADAELGQFWHHADGSLAVAGSQYTQNSTTTIDESEVLTDIEVLQPWEVVRNEASITEHFYIDGPSGQTLWSLQNPIPISAGQTINIDGIFVYQHYFPVGGRSFGAINFAVNTQEDGLGTDLTADCIGSFETDAGEGTLITITNASASDGYIISASVGGAPVYNPNDSIYTALDATSQADYGKRTFTLDTPWLESGALAQAYADFVVAELKDPKTVVRIQIQQRPTYQFGKELYIDLIRFTAATLGIDETFRIGGIKHRWLKENGLSVLTTYTLEPKLSAFTGA